jgi:hypothetical protein
MINKTLSDMRNDITTYIKKQSSNDSTLYFDKPTYNYCRNIIHEENIIDTFYKRDTPVQSQDANQDTILNIIKGYITPLNLSTKLTFVIFTVINVTNVVDQTKKQVNNPPNPPYININMLKYYLFINKNPVDLQNKLKDELINLCNKLAQFKFYNGQQIANITIRDNVTSNDFANIQDIHTYKDTCRIFIETIEANNAATLIGSLESTDRLQKVSYNTLTCCDQEELNTRSNIEINMELFKKFIDRGNDNVISDQLKSNIFKDVLNNDKGITFKFTNNSTNNSNSKKYFKRYKINYN